jgi:hypothetical protein
MDTYSLQFLPNLRLGLGANARRSDADKFHRIKDVKVQLINESKEPYKSQEDKPIEPTHTTTLIGPGDILGFYPRVVARTVPDNNTNDFEPNYFPFIEFKDPDFPWRYSLGDPDEKKRLNPWIVLLVLTRNAFTRSRLCLNRERYINTIKLNEEGLKQLPDLKNAWAWAHVQFSGGESWQDDKALSNSMVEHPEWNCSRILCLRKLEPLTLYSAFVVPWYEAGRLARLGEKSESDTYWKDPTELPVYYQWSFQTSEKGDFEDLLNKIVAEDCPPTVGTRDVDGKAPGFPLPDGEYGNFKLEGALLPLVTDEPQDSSDPKTDDAESIFSDKVKKELQRITFIEDPGDGEDPLVTIPFYGQYYQKFDEQALEGTDWRTEINLERRYRTPAGMGTQVVQQNQEEYMHLCWKQVKEVRAANEELRRASLGALISERLKSRHLDQLNSQRFLTVMEPFHHYIKNGESSLKSQISSAGIPQGLLSYPMRRVIAQKTRFADSENGSLKTYGGYLQSRIYHEQQPSGIAEEAKKEFFSASPLCGDKVTFSPLVIERASFQKSLDPKQDILERLSSMITKGRVHVKFDSLEPRMVAPKLPLAMYDYLKELSPEYLLPNLKDLKNNTVVCGIENRKFIEAYMVGLNHEMSRELVWREYPTDRKGTLFTYFWEPANEKQLDNGDIKPIDLWDGAPIGNNAQNGSTGDVRTIFAVKADLIRRYPDAVAYVVKTDTPSPSIDAWESFKGQNESIGFTVHEPQIKASINNDIRLWGFDSPITPQKIEEFPNNYFFVIEELPSLPRFGLDNEKKNEVASFDDLSWDDFVLDDKGWVDPEKKELSVDGRVWSPDSNTSAVIAQFFLQSPVLIVFPAIRFLTKEDV